MDGVNARSLKVVEEVLVQCNLIDNMLYTFIHNKSYARLLNIEPSNPVFLKSYNAEFDEIIITFTDQNVDCYK